MYLYICEYNIIYLVIPWTISIVPRPMPGLLAPARKAKNSEER